MCAEQLFDLDQRCLRIDFADYHECIALFGAYQLSLEISSAWPPWSSQTKAAYPIAVGVRRMAYPANIAERTFE